MPGKRERNRQDKRERIVAAARQLFARKGYEATTTSEIAAEAGVATGTLFLYAPTKDDLLVLVFREDMTAVIERAYQALPSRGRTLGRLLRFFGAQLDYYEHDAALGRALVRQQAFVADAERRAELTAMVRLALERTERILRRGAEAGELREDAALGDAARALFAIYFMQLGNTMSGYTGGERCRRNLERQFRVVLSGLAAA
jgi:AcrR family transcriptional regulator